MTPRPEVWLRGVSVPGVPEPLQSVAHALLQAFEEVEHATSDLDVAELWTSLGGAATVGFHLVHMSGSLDRLLTYARGEHLSAEQQAALSAEKVPAGTTPEALLRQLRATIESALDQLRATRVETLHEPRAVGRAGLPSSVQGLLHHAGEHTARHGGQIITTVRILRGLTRA